jgi:hypothetical protein
VENKNFNFDYYLRVVNGARNLVTELYAVLGYKDKSMLVQNKRRIFSAIDCAIRNLEEFKKVIENL